MINAAHASDSVKNASRMAIVQVSENNFKLD